MSTHLHKTSTTRGKGDELSREKRKRRRKRREKEKKEKSLETSSSLSIDSRHTNFGLDSSSSLGLFKMFSHQNNSPRPVDGGSASPSAATISNHQHSFYFQSDTARSTPGLAIGLDDNLKEQDESRDTGSSSSELEEGEISERDLPPPPPVQRPIPVAAMSSLEPISYRRYRKPPASYPRIEDLPFAYPSDTEQSVSLSDYNNSPLPIPLPPPPLPPYYGQFPPR
jgi:hypothetical protein